MTPSFTRRNLIKQIGLAGAALPLITPSLLRAASPASKLNIACIGVGGRGFSVLNLVAPGHNIVALCDIDDRKTPRAGIGRAAELFPDARRYRDFRKLLDQSKDIDAVTVAVPDHMHAAISLPAMQLGKHLYCEKPLAKDIWEIRQMTAAARKYNIVTQMGNQLHSSVGYRMVVQLIRDGVLGKIHEAHGWSHNNPYPDYPKRPERTDPIPAEIDWDLWIGTAPMRPYAAEIYHPRNWRSWTDFGSNLHGDMGCHIYDPVFWSLDLKPPTSLSVQSPDWRGETFHPWRIAHLNFAPTRYTAPQGLKYTWWDGGLRPPMDITGMPEGRRLPAQGSLFIGSEGTMIINHSPTAPQFFPEEKFKDLKLPHFDPLDHGQDWTLACLNNSQSGSNFDYSGPLSEAVQLGNIAARFPGERLEWDSPSMSFTNKPAANQYLKRDYRKGWDIPAI